MLFTCVHTFQFFHACWNYLNSILVPIVTMLLLFIIVVIIIKIGSQVGIGCTGIIKLLIVERDKEMWYRTEFHSFQHTTYKISINLYKNAIYTVLYKYIHVCFYRTCRMVFECFCLYLQTLCHVWNQVCRRWRASWVKWNNLLPLKKDMPKLRTSSMSCCRWCVLIYPFGGPRVRTIRIQLPGKMHSLLPLLTGMYSVRSVKCTTN